MGSSKLAILLNNKLTLIRSLSSTAHESSSLLFDAIARDSLSSPSKFKHSFTFFFKPYHISIFLPIILIARLCLTVSCNIYMSFELIEFLKPHAALLEQYLLSPDRKAYLGSLPSETDRAVLTLLTCPLPSVYDSALGRIKVKESLYNQLKEAEWIRRLQEAENPELASEAVHAIRLSKPYLNFEYTQPVPSQVYLSEEAERKALPSRLELEEDLGRYLNEQIKANPAKINELDDYGLRHLSYTTIKASVSHYELQRFLNKKEFLLSLSPEDCSDFVKTIFQTHKGSSELTMSFGFLRNFTPAQVAFMHKTLSILDCPPYYKYIFASQYQPKLNDFKPLERLSGEQMLRKRDLCYKIRLQMIGLQSAHSRQIQEALFEEMLLLDAQRGKVNPLELVEYLRRVQIIPEFLRNSSRSSAAVNDLLLDSRKITQQQIIAKCITVLFKERDPLEMKQMLQDCLPEMGLQILVTKMRLARGQAKEIANLTAIFTPQELSELKRKEITITSKNQGRLTASSDVFVTLVIRNIRQITLSIYCIDMEKHCLQGANQINPQTNLRYLSPTHSRKIHLANVDPYAQVTIHQEIKELKAKLGTFIIDFEGEGISSRAVITKGGFLVQNTMTSIGHSLRFFDAQGNHIKELALWIGGKREQIRDSYIVPYGLGSVKMIAISNGYAETIALSISAETYAFAVNYIFTEESFIAGCKAKVVLNPRLSVNGCHVSLKRLMDTKIQVQTVSNLKILASEAFEHILFDDNQDYVLEFAVKPYVQAIRITVSAEIENIAKVKTTISSQKTLEISLYEGSSNFIDFYLRRSLEANSLQVLGKNGEPIPFTPLSIVLQLFGMSTPSSHSLYTDEQGCVGLGRLSIASKLTVTALFNNEQISRSWDLSNYRQSVSYGKSSLQFIEGESLLLPLACQLMPSRDFLFIKKNPQSGICEDVTNLVSCNQHWLSCSPLVAGSYVLNLLKINLQFNISVQKGENWGASTKYYNPISDRIFQIQKNEELVFGLGSLIVEKRQDFSEVEIEILMPEGKQLPTGMKLHVFATSFENSCGDYMDFTGLNKTHEIVVQNLKQNKAVYLSNKALSEESSYVLNRNEQRGHYGNNLEKPHLFLKRTLVKSTEEEKEKLGREGGYRDQKERCLGMTQLCSHMDKSMRNCLGAFGAGQMLVRPRSLCTHNSFLQHSSHLAANLQQKTLKLSVPKGYSSLQVFLLSNKIAVKRTYALPSTPTNYIDIRHAGLADIDPQTGINVWRNAKVLHFKDAVTLSRDTLWIAVALPEILAYAKIQGVNPPSWLLQWASYSPQQRLKVYEEHSGHEINCFLKKHHPSHFEQIVKPILRTKLIKTFVDLCLLEEEAAIEFSNLPKLIKLNPFEKILLIELLMKKGHVEQASSIAMAMEEAETKTIKLVDNNFNTNFDTILNSKKKQNGNLFSMQPSNSSLMPMAYGSPIMANACFSQSLRPQLMCDFADCKEDMRSSSPKMSFQQAQQKYKKGFQEVEKTKEYVEKTYEGLKDPSDSENLLSPGLFWVELAKHITSSSPKPFVCKHFMKFISRPEYTLAACFLPLNPAHYELVNNGNSLQITSLSSFVLFIKQLGSLPFENKSGMALRQRFCDAVNRYSYDEEGLQVEREVDQFVVRQLYLVDTIVSNTTPNTFEAQILLDIPQGAMPIFSHENTQIVTQVFSPWETKSFTRCFYFPREGSFSLYPANATRNGKVIAKADPLSKLRVSCFKSKEKKENQSLEDIMVCGSEEEVLGFLAVRNIFDSFLFDENMILWKLRSKDFFLKVTETLRRRKYFSEPIWQFGYLHQDPQSIRELSERNNKGGFSSFTNHLFQYFPYYSRRAHSFADASKSTIRNKQMLESYIVLLFSALFHRKEDSSFNLAFVYYLLLQDKFAEAAALYNRVPTEHKNAHRMQSDYVQCYLDMTFGQHHDFKTARQISCRYEKCSLESWRTLFDQAKNTIFKATKAEEEVEELKMELDFTTQVINQGQQLALKIPAGVTVTVKLFEINLELYFSEFPFSSVPAFSALVPSITHTFGSGLARRQTLKRESFKDLRDIYAQVYETKDGVLPKKVSSFVWPNPKVQVKLQAKSGSLKVEVEGQKSSGSYVKVYAKNKLEENEFYRDGYVDVSGGFRYALAKVETVRQFSILVVTDKGGVMLRVLPPNLHHQEEEMQEE